MTAAQRMVQGCGQPCAAARSSYAQTDHGGTGRPLQLRDIPRKEYLYISQASPSGRLGAYGGLDRGGREKPMEEHIRGGIKDEVRAPEKVARGVKAEETRGGRGRGREDGRRRGGTNRASLGETRGSDIDSV